MPLEIFTSLQSALFPDGAVVIGISQGETFDYGIRATADFTNDIEDLTGSVFELDAKYYLGAVHVQSGENVTLTNMVLHPADPDIPDNPRQLADPIITDATGGLMTFRIPEDLYTPEVALNETLNVPIVVCQLRELTNAGADKRHEPFGIIVRHGITR